MTANIQVSGKDAAGRIFVVGGENFDEFFANANDLLGAEQTQRLVEDFQLVVNPEVAPAYAAAAPLRTPAPAANNGFGGGTPMPPPPGGPTCVHGARVRRTGTSAKGAWVGWFCPTPKGTPDQCKAQFGE